MFIGKLKPISLSVDNFFLQDYQEHQYEIHAKLISIMADRLAVHCGTLRVGTLLCLLAFLF